MALTVIITGTTDIEQGGTTTLTATVRDDDNNVILSGLEYAWSATQGVFDGSTTGSSAIYEANFTETDDTDVTVTCAVTLPADDTPDLSASSLTAMTEIGITGQLMNMHITDSDAVAAATNSIIVVEGATGTIETGSDLDITTDIHIYRIRWDNRNGIARLIFNNNGSGSLNTYFSGNTAQSVYFIFGDGTYVEVDNAQYDLGAVGYARWDLTDTDAVTRLNAWDGTENLLIGVADAGSIGFPEETGSDDITLTATVVEPSTNIVDQTALPTSNYDDAIFPVAREDPANAGEPLAHALTRDQMRAVVNVNSDWDSNSGDAEILNKPTTITSAQSTKLTGIDTGAEVNVNADWDSTSGDAQVLNKPTLAPSNAEQNVQSDWDSTSGDSQILNKPTTITSAQSTKLAGIETGAEVNIGTDLGLDRNTSDVVFQSSTGDNTTLQAATTAVAGVMSTTQVTKLNGIDSGAEVNVKSDWDATSGDSEIENKPTIPTVPSSYAPTNAEQNVKSDWNAGSGDAQILNKPTIPSGGEDNVQSDWDETNTGNDAYIENKPTLAPSNAEQNVLANWDSTSGDSQILNKPTIPSSFAPTNAERNVKSDWDSTSGDSEILNKPTTITSAQSTKLAGVETGAEVNVGTNLSLDRNTSDVVFQSNTGTNVTLQAATTSVAGVMSTTQVSKLNGIDTGAEVNVKSDWDAGSGDAQILNKPTLAPSNAEQNVKSNWNSTSGDAQILNKPTIPSSFAPTNAEQNVKSNWNSTSGDSEILNKPTIPTVPSSYAPTNAEQNV